jgi:hypothetical protein
MNQKSSGMQTSFSFFKPRKIKYQHSTTIFKNQGRFSSQNMRLFYQKKTVATPISSINQSKSKSLAENHQNHENTSKTPVFVSTKINTCVNPSLEISMLASVFRL